MVLFQEDKSRNLLPLDGEVYYYPNIISRLEAENYFQILQNLKWKPDTAIVFGKKINLERKIVWFADRPADFTYSGTKRQAINWTKEVLELKEIVQKASNFNFNSCLLNFYPTGNQGMSWHTDRSKEFSDNTTIATLSLGIGRRFDLKHIKTKQKISIFLEIGSILIMTGNTQKNWLHQIPKSLKIKEPRISLTFRQLI